MPSYSIDSDAVDQARRLIDGRQYVLDSDWGYVQPNAAAQNSYLDKHSWQEYAAWHLGLTEGLTEQTKARSSTATYDEYTEPLIASVYRASEWRHKDIEPAAHDPLQRLDAISGP